MAYIQTGFGDAKRLRGVSSLNDNAVWACGDDKTIRLYDLSGEQLDSINTRTDNWPWDIAVTISGHLVYSDPFDHSVNIIRNGHFEVNKSNGWKPRGVCSTSSGNFLVIMDSDDKQTKIVRYSGSIETQSIEFCDKDHPLYSFCVTKYISENKNQDICVAGLEAQKVVVVTQVGELRFIYDGANNDTFQPHGITTDSQMRILTADGYNSRIHILDKDGNFLRFIVNDKLRRPRGLCVDSRDNLFVAESDTGKVKRIQYST